MNPDEMLDAIREFRESISFEQREAIDEVLNDDQRASLGSVLSSTDDADKAKHCLLRFKKMLMKDPISAIKLHRKLDKRQIELVSDLIAID